MTDHEWARAFVGCEIKNTGIRFADTVDVLVKKLAQVRDEAAGELQPSGTKSENRGSPEPPQQQVA